MKKSALLILLFLLHHAAWSQYYFYDDKYYDNSIIFEAGLSGGLMNCLTDVGNSTSQLKNFNVSGGAYASLQFGDVAGLRLEYTMGKVDAADSLNSNNRTRYRNLSFRSSIEEISLTGEFYPFGLFHFQNGQPLISPYLLAGPGLFFI